MKTLLTTLCLTIVVLLGSVEVSASADYQKGLTAAQSGDYATALREWKPLGEQGDSDAQYNLGVMYDEGLGVPQDYKAAEKWYRLATEQGHADAQNNLGLMYSMGKGVPKDHKTAVKWYRLAAKQGNANAQLNLETLQKKIAKTKNTPTVAAQKSPEPSKSAEFQKGLTAAQSGDFATALQHFRPLAKQGNASAQKNLGVMYSMGKGVPKDHKTAVKWYRLAAEQGNGDAQYNLGLMYLTGQGVIQDNVYAHMWFNIAASSGDKDAVFKRDILAGKMTPAQIAKAQDFARECVRKKYKGC